VVGQALQGAVLVVVYQNRSYSTGTLRINSVYGAKDSYPRSRYDGGYSIRRSTSPRKQKPPAPMGRT